MTNGNWRKSKSMKLINRGLEVHVSMAYLPETETYRVTKIERMLGGIPTTVYDRILGGIEAIESFRHLCNESIDQEWEFPERTGTKLINLTTVEDEE